MIGRELTCKELVELVTAYLDGALSRRQQRRFESHLGGCDGCTAHLEQLRRTIAITGRLTEEQVTEEQRTVLLAAFQDWKGAS
jgi:anti-sigma factor RsiW